MRISRRNQTGKIGGSGPVRGGGGQAGKADKAASTGRGPGEVDVSISPQAAEVQRAEAVVKNLPETRVELVASIQNEVESGSYQRDSEVIAKRMVDEALREDLRKKQR